MLFNSGDIIMFWFGMIIIYCFAFAIGFVYFAIPYLRTIADRIKYNLFLAAMNFLFIKMAFDCTFALFYLRFDNGD